MVKVYMSVYCMSHLRLANPVAFLMRVCLILCSLATDPWTTSSPWIPCALWRHQRVACTRTTNSRSTFWIFIHCIFVVVTDARQYAHQGISDQSSVDGWGVPHCAALYDPGWHELMVLCCKARMRRVGLLVKTPAWRSGGTGFDSQPGHVIFFSKKLTFVQTNTAYHPSEVDKSSTSFCWCYKAEATAVCKIIYSH